MTIQSLILLHKLKKAQQTEIGEVYIEDLNAMTVHDASSNISVVTVDLSSFKTSLASVLRYLNDNNMITQTSRYTYIKLTHAGWRYWQVFWSDFLSFLFSSIAVPIVVSFFTTLLTLWIHSWS